MTYEYEELGNGVSVPCVHTDLTGSKAPGAARELKDRIFEIVDREGALLFRDAGIDGPVRYAEFCRRSTSGTTPTWAARRPGRTWDAACIRRPTCPPTRP